MISYLTTAELELAWSMTTLTLYTCTCTCTCMCTCTTVLNHSKFNTLIGDIMLHVAEKNKNSLFLHDEVQQ